MPKQVGREITVLGRYKLSPIADSLLKEYVKAFPAMPAYAVFIDKKTGSREYMLTIAPFSNRVNSMYESGAVNYFMLTDSVPVFLYTGLESFVTSDTSTFAELQKNTGETLQGEFKNNDYVPNVDFTKSWSYVHIDTLTYIVTGNTHPFANTVLKPTIEFSLPDTSNTK
jgi:hypothetical protein